MATILFVTLSIVAVLALHVVIVDIFSEGRVSDLGLVPVIAVCLMPIFLIAYLHTLL
jgi:hypothetical protein